MNTNNKTKIIFEYIISFVAITDMLLSSYAMLIQDIPHIFFYVTLPLFIVEIYFSVMSKYYLNGHLIEDYRVILLHYVKR